MCRMIAAVGRIEPAALRRALIRMAANDNPAHDHEYRSRGASFCHTDGWGMAWAQDGRLRTVRRTTSVLLDGWVERIDPLRTELLLLHARKATRAGSVSTENTHPFSATFHGHDWAFCHNGAVEDLDGLRAAPGMMPAGATDSERLFHHFLAGLDAQIEPEASLAATIAVPQDFTALHCLAASTDRVLAAACRHPEKGRPEYHALWLGEGPGLQVVSSERVDGLACSWTRLSEPGVTALVMV